MKTNNRELFTKAHAMTKQIRKAGDDYRVTFGACLRYVRNNWSKAMTFEGEKLIETVILHKSNKTMTFEIIEEPSRFAGRRAYIKGTTQYYDMDKFEAGVAKSDRAERIPA